jgi:hypothetical protein
MIQVLKRFALELGYGSLKIASAQMDHSYSIRNAVRNEDEETALVDCFVHVNRGLMKHKALLHDPEYIDTAQKHFRLMCEVTDRDIFDLLTSCVLCEWREAGEGAFADWFESVYLADNWDNGCFLRVPARFPGCRITINASSPTSGRSSEL